MKNRLAVAIIVCGVLLCASNAMAQTISSCWWCARSLNNPWNPGHFMAQCCKPGSINPNVANCDNFDPNEGWNVTNYKLMQCNVHEDDAGNENCFGQTCDETWNELPVVPGVTLPVNPCAGHPGQPAAVGEGLGPTEPR